MATRSTIALITRESKVMSIYCHWKGYLSYNGEILLKHYTDYDKVYSLISNGDLSSLNDNIDPPAGAAHTFEKPYENTCVYYHRDREEDWERTKYFVYDDIEDFEKSVGTSFVYLFNGEDNEDKWYYAILEYEENLYDGEGLKELTEEEIEKYS